MLTLYSTAEVVGYKNKSEILSLEPELTRVMAKSRSHKFSFLLFSLILKVYLQCKQTLLNPILGILKSWRITGRRGETPPVERCGSCTKGKKDAA